MEQRRCELLNLLRTGSMTKREVAKELSVSPLQAGYLLDLLEAQGAVRKTTLSSHANEVPTHHKRGFRRTYHWELARDA